jgi:hypothetical protein
MAENTDKQKNALYMLFGVLILTSTWGLSVYFPRGVDWHTAFRPATLELLSGRSPYNIQGFFNPPWTLLPLIPFAVLPENVGRALLVIAGFIAFAYTGHKMGGSKLATTAILLSPPVMHCTLNGNIDWLALLGVIMPPQIGLFFVSTKPQIGIAIAAFWLVESWRDGGWRETLRVFLPITLTGILSLLLYGMWPLRAGVEVGLWWNASLWPMSLPVGLVLIVTAIRSRKLAYAMGASPCFSPYILLHSWVVAVYALIQSTPETVAAVIGLWLLVLIRYAGM